MSINLAPAIGGGRVRALTTLAHFAYLLTQSKRDAKGNSHDTEFSWCCRPRWGDILWHDAECARGNGRARFLQRQSGSHHRRLFSRRRLRYLRAHLVAFHGQVYSRPSDGYRGKHDGRRQFDRRESHLQSGQARRFNHRGIQRQPNFESTCRCAGHRVRCAEDGLGRSAGL